MEIKVFKGTTQNRAFQFLLIFFTIYFGRDTLVNTQIGMIGSYLILGGIVLALLGIVIYNLMKKNIHYQELKKHVIWFGIITLLIVLSMFINQCFTLRYFTMILSIGIGFLMTLFFEEMQFYKMYSKVICFLVFCSIVIMYFIGNKLSFGTIINAAGLEFNNLILGYVPILNNYVRNFGIFREPGVFQFFILLALYYHLMISEKMTTKNKIEVVILILGLLTTFSVSAIVCFTILLFAFILKEENIVFILKNKKKIALVFIGVIISIVLLILLNRDIYWMVYSMMEKIMGIGKDDVRVSAIIANITLWIDSPLKGNDVNYVLGIVEHNTCSLLVIFSTFGTILGSIITYLWSRLIRVNVKTYIGKIQSVLVILFLFLFLNNQCLITNVYFYIFPIVALLSKRKSK